MKQSDYIIPFKGLAAGMHQYSFEIDNAFFDDFDFFESTNGSVRIDVTLLKEPSLLNFEFKVDGVVHQACDRCLGGLDTSISGNFMLVVKFGESNEEESDEVIVVPHEESQLDLKQYFFEYISLLLPLKRTHANESDCDPKMIKKLHRHQNHKNDPRWDALKQLKLK